MCSEVPSLETFLDHLVVVVAVAVAVGAFGANKWLYTIRDHSNAFGEYL